MIAGAAAWLLSPVDPHVWLGPLALALGAAASWGVSAWPSSSPGGVLAVARRFFAGAFALIAAVGLGASAAWVRTLAVAAPHFQGGEAPVVVEGWVVANEAGDAGPRLRLLVEAIDGGPTELRFARIAVADAGVLTAGRAARCRAVLGQPSGPLAPRAYDFARRAYFERLGATGFAYGRCRPADLPPPANALDRARLVLAALRADLSAVIVEAAPGRGGAIGAALVTGDRSSVDVATNEALRDSGLGHLLSVSGIHMGVVGGLVFALMLRALALVGPIALRWPVKKIAAIAALAALAAYLIVSGASVPAQRSFIMACVAFGAILIDRPAISMRGLALAAAIVVIGFPESVLEPGFQMSFAATMALVALFEAMRKPDGEPALPTPGPLIGALQSASRGIGAVLMISLVAGLATDPFAIYHFQRFSLYSLPANLIVAPIMSFLVAPLAALAAVLAPFGAAEPALELMASALDLIAAVAEIFGDRPEAVRAVSRPPDAAFLLWAGALVWACLWRGALRWVALAPAMIGVALHATAPLPVVAFDGDLRAIYVRENAGWTLIVSRGRSTYARDRLGAMLGLSPPVIEALAPPLGCSGPDCVVATPAGDIAIVAEPSALASACAAASVTIALFEVGESDELNCTIIDAADRARRGGGFVYADGTRLRVERALDPAVRRPWTLPVGGGQE